MYRQLGQHMYSEVERTGDEDIDAAVAFQTSITVLDDIKTPLTVQLPESVGQVKQEFNIYHRCHPRPVFGHGGDPEICSHCFG